MSASTKIQCFLRILILSNKLNSRFRDFCIYVDQDTNYTPRALRMWKVGRIAQHTPRLNEYNRAGQFSQLSTNISISMY